jgi:hypothetical protein
MGPHLFLGIFDASATSLKLAVKVLTLSVGPSLYLGQFGRWEGNLSRMVSPSIVKFLNCLRSSGVVPPGALAIRLYHAA